MKVLLIGNGAREHAIGEALVRSRHKPELIVFADKMNPGLVKLAAHYELTDSLSNFEKLKALAEKTQPDFAFVGPDNPIADGAADVLNAMNVPTVAPTKILAQLESSKSFTRKLLQDHDIVGSPEFMVFQRPAEGVTRDELASYVRKFLEHLGGNFVVKADGLTGGKGVKVTGDHLSGIDDGLHYAMRCIDEDGRVVVEEKLEGEEFSLMYFTDGLSLAPMPVVQDHKRAFEDDKGPNTGGMGSYTDENNSLPFLRASDLAEARRITEEVLVALKKETGELFKGILYGGFMATRDGVRLIEYNARFGDPETMNVLPILKTDFVDVCQAILNGTLAELPLEFERKATVVKYVVPNGYPDAPEKNKEVKLFGLPEGCRVYYAAVNMDETGKVFTTGSRTLGFVGIADTLARAEQIAEAGTKAAEGALFHRRDIGTEMLVNKRMMHMLNLRK